jgi:hypothetical protein
MECNKQRVEHLKEASKHLNIASSLSCGKIWKANPLCGTRIKTGHFLYEKECVPPKGGKRKSLLKKKRTKSLFKKKRRGYGGKSTKKRGYGGKSPKKRGHGGKSTKRRGYGGKSTKRRKRR